MMKIETKAAMTTAANKCKTLILVSLKRKFLRKIFFDPIVVNKRKPLCLDFIQLFPKELVFSVEVEEVCTSIQRPSSRQRNLIEFFWPLLSGEQITSAIDINVVVSLINSNRAPERKNSSELINIDSGWPQSIAVESKRNIIRVLEDLPRFYSLIRSQEAGLLDHCPLLPQTLVSFSKPSKT